MHNFILQRKPQKTEPNLNLHVARLKQVDNYSIIRSGSRQENKLSVTI